MSGKVAPSFALRNGSEVLPGHLVSYPYDRDIYFGISYRTPKGVSGMLVFLVNGEPVQPFLRFLSESDRVLQMEAEWRISIPIPKTMQAVSMWDKDAASGHIVATDTANYILTTAVVAGHLNYYYLDTKDFLLYSQGNRPGEAMGVEFLIKRWKAVLEGEGETDRSSLIAFGVGV
jgi:hypothetical protein